ncbi:MAG: hypothetical protein EOP38_00465 [Rubrivivax sp.]|nr:MAG: hypothetical protein EOP38_00465 [Rubrivivax sp.]
MKQAQRGFSGVLVIVALVLISSLVAFGITLMTSVQSGYSQELSSARVKQAAEAGLDWGRYQLKRLPVANCPAVGVNVALPASMAPYTVTVVCTSNGLAYADGGTAVSIYTLTATACRLPQGALSCPANTDSPDYVEKTLTTWVE